MIFLLTNDLSEKELKLLTHLRTNCRQSLASIGRKINMPVSTVFDKLNKLEQSVISKHATIIDFPKLGYHIRVNFVLKSFSKKELIDFLKNNKNTNSVSTVQGDFDFYIETVFQTLKDYEEFLEELSEFKISEQQIFYVIEDIKRESFLTKDSSAFSSSHKPNELSNQPPLV